MRTALTVAIVLILVSALPARARQVDSMADLLARLEAQAELIRALQARIEDLEGRSAGTPAPTSEASQVVAADPPPAHPAEAAETGDGWAAQAHGRIDVDAWAADGAPSGALVRRARLTFSGGRAGGPIYVFTTELANGSASILDAYVDLPLAGAARARLGRHRIPFSLAGQTSESYGQFLERPVGLEPFIPNWANGASLMLTERSWSAQAGLFSREGEGEDDDLVLGGRVSWAPIREAARYLHLAAAANHTWLAEDGVARIRQRPEQRLAAYVLDTGPIRADGQDDWGLEAAYSAGAWGLVAEGAAMVVSREKDDPLVYTGYALEAWWTLTGEVRPYRIDGGVFARLEPFRAVDRGGSGAWQIVGRYSGLDLDDALHATGRIEAAAVGVNWYLTERLKFMLDVSRSLTWTDGERVSRLGIGARVHVDW